jgi:hypothetical protein
MAQSQGVTTHTTLTAETREIGGRSVPAYAATVSGEDGTPATGIVILSEKGRTLASAALDSQGVAHIFYDGSAPGDHTVLATYAGDTAHAASQSEGVQVRAAAATGVPDFTLTISPTSLTAITPGDTGNVTATITSLNQFTGFLSLSCAGPPVTPGSSTDNAMPVGVTCTFTPANLQITSAVASSANPTLTSYLTVQTEAPSGANAQNRAPKAAGSRDSAAPLALAVLLPGIVGLGVLGRKRKFFGRIALLLLVGAVTVVGTTSCSQRYSYLKHPPTYNPGTVPGSYTLTVWAQTSDGVTASEHFTTLGLTVK